MAEWKVKHWPQVTGQQGLDVPDRHQGELETTREAMCLGNHKPTDPSLKKTSRLSGEPQEPKEAGLVGEPGLAGQH